MTAEKQYAIAVFELVSANPDKAEEYLANLKKTLTTKGHQKLMSRIFAEYKTIIEKKDRTKKYGVVTPESERTRVLLELYRTLLH